MFPISLQKSSKPPPLSRIFVRLLLPVGMLEVDPNNLSSLLLFAGQNLFFVQTPPLFGDDSIGSAVNLARWSRVDSRRRSAAFREKKGGPGALVIPRTPGGGGCCSHRTPWIISLHLRHSRHSASQSNITAASSSSTPTLCFAARSAAGAQTCQLSLPPASQSV